MARRKDHTREELATLILEAAGKIVAKDGGEALTARALATAIGYVPGTIYNVFGNMDEVCLHLNARTLDALHEVLARPSTHPHLADQLKDMADAYLNFARKHRPHWLMLFAANLPVERKNKEWYQAKIDRLFEPLEHLLAAQFPRDQKPTARLAARVLWSSVHGICYLQESGKIPLVAGAMPAKVMIDHLVDTYLAGAGLTKRRG